MTYATITRTPGSTFVLDIYSSKGGPRTGGSCLDLGHDHWTRVFARLNEGRSADDQITVIPVNISQQNDTGDDEAQNGGSRTGAGGNDSR